MFLEDLNSSVHGFMTVSQAKIYLTPINFLPKIWKVADLMSYILPSISMLLSLVPDTYKQLEQRLQTTVSGPWKQVAWDFPSQPETHTKGLEKKILGWVCNWRQFSSLRLCYSHFIFRVYGHLCILPPCCLPILPMNVQPLIGPWSLYSQSRISHHSRWEQKSSWAEIQWQNSKYMNPCLLHFPPKFPY